MAHVFGSINSDGTINSGSSNDGRGTGNGFSVTSNSGAGSYTISFNSDVGGTPCVVASANPSTSSGRTIALPVSVGSGGFNIQTYVNARPEDVAFSFDATIVNQ